MGSRQGTGRHQLWQVNPHLHYRGDQRDRGPIGRTKVVLLERGGGEGPNIPEGLRQNIIGG